MIAQVRRVRCWRSTWLALPVALAFGCSSGAPPPPPPPEVTVAQPTRAPIERTTEFTGTLRAVATAEIRARVSGTLEQIFFEPSAVVKKGDVLFEIERRTYQAAYDEAVANLASAEAALARAQSDLKRIQAAIAERAVSQRDLDQARADRDQAHASVLTAKARIEQAEIDLDYTRVTSPITGQVGRNLVDVGNLVGAGEATLLTTVNDIQPIHVYFNAPEQLILNILELRRKGRLEDAGLGTVRVATASDEGFPHEGQIDFIANTVDPATGTIEVRAVLPNTGFDEIGQDGEVPKLQDATSPVLFSGLFVRVRMVVPAKGDAVLVNERAIGTDLGGKYVLLVGDDEVVEQRYVTLGPIQDDGTVVVDDGLDGAERYIVNGLLRARPGLPVRPQTEQEVAGEAAAG